MKRTMCVGLLIVVAMLLVGSAALADCDSNKVPVTLINPAGKAIELCLPENAVSGLEQGAAASGAQLLLAQCPCFAPEEVDAAGPLDCEVTASNPPFSKAIECRDQDENLVFRGFWCDESLGIACVSADHCNSPTTELSEPDLTLEEANACVEILSPQVPSS